MGKKQNMEWLACCRATTKWLAMTYPLVFSHVMRPLKIGITQDIIAAKMDGTPDEQWIARAIGYWVRSSAYLRQMKPGSARIGLDGLVSGHVSDDEADIAKASLLAYQQKVAQKAEQIRLERLAEKNKAASEVASSISIISEEADTLIINGEVKKILTLKKKPVRAVEDA